MTQTIAAPLTGSMSLFCLLVGVDKGRDVCTSLDYRSTGWQAAHNIPLSTPPSPLPQLSSDPIACYGVGLDFKRISNIFLANQTVFHILNPSASKFTHSLPLFLNFCFFPSHFFSYLSPLHFFPLLFPGFLLPLSLPLPPFP